MIFYIILLCLHTCHCITVTRGELFDTASGGEEGTACKNTCTCPSPTATYFHLSGEEKCMGANETAGNPEEIVTRLKDGDYLEGRTYCKKNCLCPSDYKTYFNLPSDRKCIDATGTGCSQRVDGYTSDVPLITQSMLNKTEFRITKDSGNLCPNTRTTFTSSSVRMLALTDKWEVVPTFMSNLISLSIPNVKEVNVKFYAVWPGLLIKLEVKCKANNAKEYTPRENCVLFKYEGTATYPLKLSSFTRESSTTAEPTVSTTSSMTTTTTTTTTIPTPASSTPVTSTSTTHSGTSIPSSPTTGTSKDNNDNRDIAMAAGFAATVILILVTIIIILICYKRTLDRKTSSRTVAYTKSNIEENIYDKVNKKEEDEKKGESGVIEFPNTTYGNRINLYAKVGIQKQDSHYYNTSDINKNVNYYNVYAGKETSHVDNKAINTMNVNEYDQIWSNNDGDKKIVESSKSGHGGDKCSRDDEENDYTVTGGLSHNI